MKKLNPSAISQQKGLNVAASLTRILKKKAWKKRNAETYYVNLYLFPDTFGAIVMSHEFLKAHFLERKNILRHKEKNGKVKGREHGGCVRNCR